MYIMTEKLKKIAELLEVLDTLREKCPWDKKQTNESLRNNTIEECFELCDAIDNSDDDNIKEELGDVFLHILFYSKMAEERGVFDIGDVAKEQVAKLKYRHPHIYSDTKVSSVEDVLENWDKLKKEEKKEYRKTVLSGVSNSIPAMLKADKIQSKVAKVGFDWKKPEDIWAKIDEEILESREAIEMNKQDLIEEELGDLLFTVVNACRLYGVSAETALEKCNKKFMKRFNLLETIAVEQGIELKSANVDKMEELWQNVKIQLRSVK